MRLPAVVPRMKHARVSQSHQGRNPGPVRGMVPTFRERWGRLNFRSRLELGCGDIGYWACLSCCFNVAGITIRHRWFGGETRGSAD